MDFNEYRRMDATAMAQAVARGEVQAEALLACARTRAEAVNPTLNAIIGHIDVPPASQAEVPGPFAGVPFLVKDLYQEVEGEAYAWGCRALRRSGPPAQAHAEITRRWIDAGLVIFGRTSTPEFGAKGITEPEAFGPARNAWNPAHTPGGSSGGSATAVAAGIVPMAGANDGGGSIRIPAACCGLFGLKPGRGRTPVGPMFAEMMHGAAVNHVVTRSVRDSAVLLDATHGPQPAAPYHLAPPARSFAEAAATAPGRLRIAFSTRSPIGTEVHAECRRAVEQTAELLLSLGHQVEEAEPALDGAQLARDFLTMWFAHCAATIDHVKVLTGSGDDGFELDTRAMAALGRLQRASDYVIAHERWGGYLRSLSDFYGRHDMFMTPTMALPPARVGEIATPGWQHALLRVILKLRAARLLTVTGVVDQMVQDNLRWVPFTQLANLTGTPAMSVPLHWTPQGLPVGVQFCAGVGDEGRLFSLAAQLETARPWLDRVAPELPG